MKNYIRIIPLTGLAAAIALGGSLSAAETAPKGASMKDKQRQSQQSARYVDQTDQADSRPMTASEVLGMNIDTIANEKIGEIDEIFIDSHTGEVLAMVVSTGGFLGMGQQQSLISPEDLRFNDGRTHMQTDISKDQIQAAPTYQKGETAGLDKVRPLGKSAADWDMRKDRQARAEMRPAAAHGQKASYRATTGQARNERERANRLEGVQPDSRGLAVSELIGMSVENRQGESVGNVDEVYLDLEKREVVGVVVSTGGFLGMGDTKTLFGLREMSFDPKNEKVILEYSRDQIRGFPAFKTDDQSVFADLRERMGRLGTRVSNYISGDDNARTDARTDARTVGRLSDKTVFDQGNSSEEIAMTASIRTAIREDDSLSRRANNVTIITQKGKVVLRGEVDSAAEKTTVEGIARNKAGRQNVTSELIVRGGEQANK
jgi:sporulation protein YlmC with PRC-barrel domain